MTIGIGVLCDGGETAILATDMRVTYRGATLPPTDAAGKQYDFAPFLLAAAVAGEPRICHPVISEISEWLRKVLIFKDEHPEAQFVLGHVRRVIENSRRKELRRLQECAMQSELGISLETWLAGKLPTGDGLDQMAFDWGRVVLKRTKENMSSSLGLILLGFVDNGIVFFRARGAEPLEEAASPEIHAIGSGSRAAMEVLIRRKQNIFTSAARSLLHVYEALKAARMHEKTVGPPAAYCVIRPGNVSKPNGLMRFPAESTLLRGWYRSYQNRASTESLDGDLPNEQVRYLLQHHSPAQVLSHETFELMPTLD